MSFPSTSVARVKAIRPRSLTRAPPEWTPPRSPHPHARVARSASAASMHLYPLLVITLPLATKFIRTLCDGDESAMNPPDGGGERQRREVGRSSAAPRSEWRDFSGNCSVTSRNCLIRIGATNGTRSPRFGVDGLRSGYEAAIRRGLGGGWRSCLLRRTSENSTSRQLGE
jgi:hypothetical protein